VYCLKMFVILGRNLNHNIQGDSFIIKHSYLLVHTFWNNECFIIKESPYISAMLNLVCQITYMLSTIVFFYRLFS